MMEFLKKFFEENYIVDDREPLVTFHIPNTDGTFSLLAPKLEPWKQLLFFNFLQSIIQVVFAFFIYEGIVKRRGTIGSFILGWGIIIPASLYLPFYLLNVLDLRYVFRKSKFLRPQTTWIYSHLISSFPYLFLRNKVMCLGSSTAMSVIFFRCIEAMYGTSPAFVELSKSNYIGYYGSLVRTTVFCILSFIFLLVI